MRRAGAVAVLMIVSFVAPGCGDSDSPTSASDTPATSSGAASASPDDLARAAAKHFLDRYVEPDGRVARHDQGDDTVSEGPSYALLLAQVAGDQATFDRVWQWTATHLARPDGLLSAHASSDGTILDSNAATDADLVIAWALLRDTGPSADANHAAGRALADAILQHETVTLSDGSLVLAAGNWATEPPGTVNPSYWALPALEGLALLTNDARWTQIADTSVRLVAEATDNGQRLPPDWAQIDGASITAIASPNHDVPEARYSFDAHRVVPWFAAGSEEAAQLAAKWSALLDDERGGASALGLDGSVIDGNAHPTALVAAAAAVSAAGHDDVRDARLKEAESLDAEHPTYYGSAWIALARALLTTDVLRP